MILFLLAVLTGAVFAPQIVGVLAEWWGRLEDWRTQRTLRDAERYARYSPGAAQSMYSAREPGTMLCATSLEEARSAPVRYLDRVKIVEEILGVQKHEQHPKDQ